MHRVLLATGKISRPDNGSGRRLIAAAAGMCVRSPHLPLAVAAEVAASVAVAAEAEAEVEVEAEAGAEAEAGVEAGVEV